MFTVTIHAETAQHLASIVKHLESMDVPAFLKSEVKKSAAPTPAAKSSEKAGEDISSPTKPEKPKVAKALKEEKKSSLTYDDDIKSATFSVAGLPGKGPQLITGILGEFGVGHAKELKEEQWAEYIEKCKACVEKNKEPANFA